MTQLILPSGEGLLFSESVLPSVGGLASAQLHVARTICRRAERSVIQLSSSGEVESPVAVFLNRLSDYLFVTARFMAKKCGRSEQTYKKASLTLLIHATIVSVLTGHLNILNRTTGWQFTDTYCTSARCRVDDAGDPVNNAHHRDDVVSLSSATARIDFLGHCVIISWCHSWHILALYLPETGLRWCTGSVKTKSGLNWNRRPFITSGTSRGVYQPIG